MDFRLNPVALVTGAASSVGAACAATLAARARGGLIMVDADEAGLSDAADALPAPPERVSTLAFSAADSERWQQAAAFLNAQYGRLDWALACFPADPAASPGDILTLTDTLARLMKPNTQGGAIVLVFPDAPARAEHVAQLVRLANKESGARVRVCAVVREAEAALWRNDASFEALVRECGDENAALLKLAGLEQPLARCQAGAALPALADMLLASDADGVTLVVDASPAL